MDSAIWSLAQADGIEEDPLVVVLGGPHSGRSKLLSLMWERGISRFQTSHVLPVLLSVSPYDSPMAESRMRLASGLIRATVVATRRLATEDGEGLIGVLQCVVRKRGWPEQLSPASILTGIGTLDTSSVRILRSMEPLRWVLDVIVEFTAACKARPLLIVDEADRLLMEGLEELLYLIGQHRVYQVVLAARSLVATDYDSPNRLSEYIPSARFLCLDFQPDAEAFGQACHDLLNRRAEEGSTDAQKILPDKELFEAGVRLSGGQLGRFVDFVKLFGERTPDRRLTRLPKRQELERFCHASLNEILEREPSHDLATKLRTLIDNLKNLNDRILANVSHSWIDLGSLSKAEPSELSLARCGVLNWVLHSSTDARIKVAIDSRFVPSRVTISPMAALLGRLPLKKIVAVAE